MIELFTALLSFSVFLSGNIVSFMSGWLFLWHKSEMSNDAQWRLALQNVTRIDQRLYEIHRTKLTPSVKSLCTVYIKNLTFPDPVSLSFPLFFPQSQKLKKWP